MRRRSRWTSQEYGIADISPEAKTENMAHKEIEVTVHRVHVDEVDQCRRDVAAVQFAENPWHQQHFRFALEGK